MYAGSSDIADLEREEDTKHNKPPPLFLDQIDNPQTIFSPLFPPKSCNGRGLGRNFGKSGSSTLIKQHHLHTVNYTSSHRPSQSWLLQRRMEIQTNTAIPGTQAPALEVRKWPDKSHHAESEEGFTLSLSGKRCAVHLLHWRYGDIRNSF